MKRSRYSEIQFFKILIEVEIGRMIKEVCREYGISDTTCYNLKARYGGKGAPGEKRLKEVEVANRRMKQMYA